MADPSPTDAGDAEQNSAADEGKNPAEEGASASEEPKRRTYSESYVKQLRAEQADNRNRISELEEKLQERENAGKSEVERLTERAIKAEQERDAAEAFRLRVDVASEHGFDLSAVELLSGNTREEVELRAEQLGKLLDATKTKPVASFDGGARQTAKEPLPPEQAHNEFLLRAMGRTPERRAT
jgi:hypothetical protein